MAERAREGWITVTELADTLTRDHDLAFKASHAVASRFVAEASRRSGDPLTAILRDASKSVLGRGLDYDEKRLAEILSPEHFVRIRSMEGGPAPAATARAVDTSRERLRTDERWIRDTEETLRRADEKLKVSGKRL
jgi:argininosuccinate lyase